MEFFGDINSETQDELTETFKEFSIKLHESDINFCSKCNISMKFNQIESTYLCDICGYIIYSERSVSDTCLDLATHSINIASASGKIYSSYGNNCLDARIWKRIEVMNSKLKIPLHHTVMEKIFQNFKQNKSIHRAKKVWAMLAFSTITICEEVGVLISNEDIQIACGIKSNDYNFAKKANRCINISAEPDIKSTTSITDKVLKVIRTFMNNLKIDDKYEKIILLYFNVHKNMTESSNTINSRVAGAIWCLNHRAKLNISEKTMVDTVHVSISTFKNDIAKNILKILNNVKAERGLTTPFQTLEDVE
jgi:transcription initiation factor TFIIIB Brf1 subunit/transcription initiation factor TFIIB